MRRAGRRALLVAATGGHLEQITRLEPRLSPAFDEIEYATFDDQQSRSLLEGRPVHHVLRIPPRGYKQVLQVAPAAWNIVRRGGYSDVISTGSAIAMPFLAAARLTGARAHYVESAARSDRPSLTGRTVARIPGINLYTQYTSWADQRWQWHGSVFDPFVLGDHERAVDSASRVVVTLGTMRSYPFRRAVQAIKNVLSEVAKPDVEVLWQVGDTPVDDLGIVGHNLIPARELNDAMHESDLVFAHAGIGSCLQVLDSGRAPVLLPRRSAQGEHIDDHQLLIAAELEARDLAVSRDPYELTAEDAISAMHRQVTVTGTPRPFELVS